MAQFLFAKKLPKKFLGNFKHASFQNVDNVSVFETTFESKMTFRNKRANPFSDHTASKGSVVACKVVNQKSFKAKKSSKNCLKCRPILVQK